MTIVDEITINPKGEGNTESEMIDIQRNIRSDALENLSTESIPEIDKQKELFLKAQREINNSVEQFNTHCDDYKVFCHSRGSEYRRTINEIRVIGTVCKNILEQLDIFKNENPESIWLFTKLDQVRGIIFKRLTYLKKNVNPMTESGEKLFDKWISQELFERFTDK